MKTWVWKYCFAIQLVSFAVGLNLPSAFNLAKYPGYASLESASKKKIDLHWQVDGTEIECVVISENGPTWVGIGVSQNGGMTGADIVVGRQNELGKFELMRLFAGGFYTPEKQSTQRVTLIASYQDYSTTAFILRRPLQAACNNTQEQTIYLDRPNWIIFAFGSANNFYQHSTNNRGQTLIDFKGSYFPSIDSMVKDPLVTVLDLVSEPVTIPAKTTSYCYTWYNLESLALHHVIAEEPVLKSPYVHHFVGYVCDSPLDGKRYGGIQAGGQNSCNKGLFDPNEMCQRFYFGWGKGGKAKYYPSNAGKPIGQGGGQKAAYLLVETHFNNPDGDVGQVDSGSGYRLYITSKLRPNHVGMLQLGALPTNYTMSPIPPGLGSYSKAFECPSKCTSSSSLGFPPQGITVLSSFMHMHTAGIEGYTQIIRNNEELEPLNSMKYFDFNFQNYRYMPASKKVYPGDRLITTCVWRTKTQSEPVYPGFGSNQEMCMDFIEYYPIVQLFSCGEANTNTYGDLFYCRDGSNGSGVQLMSNGDKPAYRAFTESVCRIQQPVTSTKKTTATKKSTTKKGTSTKKTTSKSSKRAPTTSRRKTTSSIMKSRTTTRKTMTTAQPSSKSGTKRTTTSHKTSRKAATSTRRSTTKKITRTTTRPATYK